MTIIISQPTGIGDDSVTPAMLASPLDLTDDWWIVLSAVD